MGVSNIQPERADRAIALPWSSSAETNAPCGSGPAGNSPPGSTGFSLIELLVVIAIVGLLASITLPAVARARSSGKSAVCAGNLRQWGLATHVYAADHDDFLPPDGSPNGSSTKSGWYIDLPKTLSVATYAELDWPLDPGLPPPPGLWVCPSSTNRSNGRNLFFYCLNQHVNDTGAANRTVSLDSLRSPGRTVWLFDNGRRAAVAQQNNVSTSVHQQGAQFLFLDGHVARFRAKDYWDDTA